MFKISPQRHKEHKDNKKVLQDNRIAFGGRIKIKKISCSS